MPVKRYDKKNSSKPYGVKWGHWKTPSFKFFGSEAEREEYFALMQQKEQEDGSAALRISNLEAQVMRRCLELVGNPETVLVACEAFSGQRAIQKISSRDAVKEYLDEKMNIGRDENYYRAIRNMLDRFLAAFPGSLVLSLTAQDARSWVAGLNYAPVTIKNHRTTLKCFFNWCVQRGYARENIFKAVPVPDVILPEPEFLTVDQLRLVLGTAIKSCPDALPYLVLQAFGGLRASACAKLDVQNVKFAQRGILIRADMAKNKRRIFVDGHPDNLWEWLEFARRIAPEGFELTKRQYDRRKDQIARLSKFRMPHNALRHSFCTYHVAKFGDAGKTATLLTHRGNVALLYEHYRGNATREEGEQYFSIKPKENEHE